MCRRVALALEVRVRATGHERIDADSTRLEKAIAETEEQIKEAETMLHTTLPLEARRLGANPEWLKPPGITPQ